MTRIDFHTNIGDKLAYACRLTRKAYAAGTQLVILTSDAAQATRLDAMLWTLSDTDFLPHVQAHDPLAAHTPIIVTHDGTFDTPHYDMLVNLTRATPPQFARYARVFEIISADAADAAAARQRYVAYKQQAYRLTHCVVNQR